jgi:hypothetical protein
VLALFGAGAGVAAAILALSLVVSGWLAALIVALALFVLAGMIALAGRRGVKRASPPVPTEAVRSTKDDVAAVRQAVRR